MKKPFLKFDSGKPRYTLVPPLALLEVAKVLTYGAQKYDPDNWLRAFEDDVQAGVTRYMDAAIRHIEQYRGGEEIDESGLPHLAHAICSLMFILAGTAIMKERK